MSTSNKFLTINQQQKCNKARNMQRNTFLLPFSSCIPVDNISRNLLQYFPLHVSCYLDDKVHKNKTNILLSRKKVHVMLQTCCKPKSYFKKKIRRLAYLNLKLR